MPRMTADDFFEKAIERFFDAKRALLRAYFGTEESHTRDRRGRPGLEAERDAFYGQVAQKNRENGS